MRQILENLGGLGTKRLALLGGTGLAMLAGIFFGVSTIFAPTFVPVYSQLTPATASDMTRSLEQAGIQVQLSRTGDVISVPEEDVARARMALADSGLPNEGVPGWELFDDVSGMGMNSFMQQVNRLRALEGELARSIQTIDGIESARVHLVLPEREAFSRTRPEASASVIVRSRINTSLSRKQGMAIQALVASAVPDLDPQKITVLSASGETILAEEDASGSDISLQSQRAQIEERLARNVEAILNARVGPGNARVEVSVDLTTERETRVTRSFDPDQQVARSIETRTQKNSETDPAGGNVDVANNIPDALRDPAAGGAQSSSSSNNSDEIINYEIGSVEAQTVREPGDIERLSVAVLVNGSYDELPDGTTGYVARTPEEIARLEQLVRTAIGFDESRGDQVSIDSLQFKGFDADLTDPVGRSIGTVLANNMMSILRALFALAAIAMVMLLGGKPLRQILDAGNMTPALAGAGGDASMLTDSRADQRALPGPTEATQRSAVPQITQERPAPGTQVARTTHTGTVLDPEDARGRDTVSLASVEGGIRRTQLQNVTSVVQDQPEDALRVVNSWLAER